MKSIILSAFLLSFFLPGNGPKINYQEEVSTALSIQSAFQKSTDYLNTLPNVDKLSKKKSEGSAAEGFTACCKSFMVYKSNQFYRQPKAEVHYKVKVELLEGKYRYQFSDFKVYTYKRNRYGVFARSSSKAFGLEQLSSAKQKELKPLIAIEVAKYINGLKNALAL